MSVILLTICEFKLKQCWVVESLTFFSVEAHNKFGDENESFEITSWHAFIPLANALKDAK